MRSRSCYTRPVRRAFLVEDEPWIRGAVAATLARGGFQVVAACGTINEANRALVGAVDLDVALIDVGLPDGSGLSLLPRVKEASPRVSPVVFTVFDDEATVFAALRAGARGYLLKSTALDELPRLLSETADGGSVMSPAIARMVLDSFAPEPRVEPALSPREREILGLLALGHTYADVGRALGIRLGTVQSHVKVLYDKLHVASKAEAALEAIKLGLVCR